VKEMHARIFGALVAKPISFPDDLEISVFPLRRHDESQIGRGSFIFEDHRSWDWVQRHYPVNSEDETHIKAGNSISVFRGDVTTGFPDGTQFPEESDVTILEPSRD
jgi:hypothetical protein